jgi:hypothetical protein
VYQLNLRRKEFIETIAHNGVGLAATYFHQHPVPGDAFGDFFGQGFGYAFVPVLIDVLHVTLAPLK